jgi:AcrR family transcriptional regulator
MQATSRTEQKAATRAIVLAAAKAVFLEVGYDAATIRGIAARAQRSTGSVFAHWDGKASLYREIFGHAPVTPEVGAGLLSVMRRALDSGETLYGVDVDMARALVAQAQEA